MHIVKPIILTIPSEESSYTPDQKLWREVLFRTCHDIDHYINDPPHNLSKYTYARQAQKWILHNRVTTGGFLWAVEAVYDDPDPVIKYMRCKAVLELPLPHRGSRTTMFF